MPYPPDLIVDNETVPVALPAVTGRLIVSSKIAAASASFLFGSFSFQFSPIFVLLTNARITFVYRVTFASLSKTNFVSSVRQRVSY